MTRLAIIALALALTGCAPPLGRLNPGAAVPYVLAEHAEMQAFRAPKPPRNVSGVASAHMILELHLGANPWTAAHECAHLADFRGITYRQAMALLTPPGTVGKHMAQRLASMQAIADAGGDHWQAIKDRWGADAVAHSDILARLH